MKLRLPKRRRYRIYLYLLSILIILVAIDLLLVRIGRHITIAKDTTYITSPLKPDGTPDYFQAIDDQRAAGVTPTNNAAMILIPLVYSGQLMDEEKAEVFQKLHVLPPENEATAFVHYLGYLSRKHGEPFARAHMARHTTYQPDDDERAGDAMAPKRSSIFSRVAALLLRCPWRIGKSVRPSLSIRPLRSQRQR